MSDLPEVVNYSPKELRENNGPSLENITSNKKRSKKRDWNEYSKLTGIVRKYKDTNNEKYLIEAIKCLEGIINTFTLIICPGDANQQIGYLNPYMKKFLGMFLSPEERVNTTYNMYMQAVYRIRWIMRYWTYEDLYSYIVFELIKVIKSMRIITSNGTTCECFYYIQLVIKYKMSALIIKTAKDIMVDIKEMPSSFSDNNEESMEDILDRITFDPENYNYEDKIIDDFYGEIDLSTILNNTDIFKCFTYYEKYILYMHDYLGLTINKISSILKFDSLDELTERIEDIKLKLDVINKEMEN